MDNTSQRHVLVTGANGYIGTHVVRELLKNGCRVTASDLISDSIDSQADFTNIPILADDADIYERLGRPDTLIHLAWRNGFSHNVLSHLTDLSYHYVFLKRMLDSGLRSLSVMGTMHEIGLWEGEIDETTPTNPLNLYGIAKNSLRQSLFTLAGDTRASIHWLRGFYIYGDDQRNHSIFTKILQAEKDNEPYFPFNSGKNRYDFISVDELSEQIVKASLQDDIQGIINCCSGRGVPLCEKVEDFIMKNRLNIRLKYNAFPDRPYDSTGIWGNPEKIQKIMENSQKRDA